MQAHPSSGRFTSELWEDEAAAWAALSDAMKEYYEAQAFEHNNAEPIALGDSAAAAPADDAVAVVHPVPEGMRTHNN